MANRRPPRKRAATTTRSRKRTTRKDASLLTTVGNAADETKDYVVAGATQARDYVVSGATQARDYIAKHPALAVAAGAAVIAIGWSARRMWLPAVAIAAAERYLPDLPSFDRVVGQIKSLRPSFI